MALLQCNIRSAVLGMDVAFCAIVPERQSEHIRTIYLLHGLNEDCTGWCRYSSIERYARDMGIAVIMPGAQKSFYTDMAYGDAYFTFITNELVTLTRNLFHLSHRREDTFVGGLSMGGYGAYKMALTKPEQYGGAAALSGALDVGMLSAMPEAQPLRKLILGDVTDARGTEHDLMHLASDLAKSGRVKPRLYQACGTEDFLYGANTSFRIAIAEKGFDHRYEEGPGEHSWSFWDMYIQKALAFLLEE